MNTEELLRKYFGLKGEFYTEEWKHMLAIEDQEEQMRVMNSILDEETADCKRQFTREAWDAWRKALDMLTAMWEEGYIGCGTEGSYEQFFWECLPEA